MISLASVRDMSYFKAWWVDRPTLDLSIKMVRGTAEEPQILQPQRPSAPPSPNRAQAISLLNASLDAFRAKDFERCIESATRATVLDPSLAGAFTNLGICSGALGRWDEGIRASEEALRIDPTSQLARNNLAWMRAEKAKR